MCAVNTFQGSKDTFYGARCSSRIDFVCMPDCWRYMVRMSKVLDKEGRMLQIVADEARKDHFPLLIAWEPRWTRPEAVPKMQWDHEMIADCLLKMEGRAEVVAAVEARLKGATPGPSSKARFFADMAWEELVAILQEVAQEYFGVAARQARKVRHDELRETTC